MNRGTLHEESMPRPLNRYPQGFLPPPPFHLSLPHEIAVCYIGIGSNERDLLLYMRILGSMLWAALERFCSQRTHPRLAEQVVLGKDNLAKSNPTGQPRKKTRREQNLRQAEEKTRSSR